MCDFYSSFQGQTGQKSSRSSRYSENKRVFQLSEKSFCFQSNLIWNFFDQFDPRESCFFWEEERTEDQRERETRIFGLSATPTRKDGLTKVLHWFMGPTFFSIEQKKNKKKGEMFRVSKRERERERDTNSVQISC